MVVKHNLWYSSGGWNHWGDGIMNKVVIALVGGFGGIAPSLVDKAQALYSGDVEKWLTTTANP